MTIGRIYKIVSSFYKENKGSFLNIYGKNYHHKKYDKNKKEKGPNLQLPIIYQSATGSLKVSSKRTQSNLKYSSSMVIDRWYEWVCNYWITLPEITQSASKAISIRDQTK